MISDLSNLFRQFYNNICNHFAVILSQKPTNKKTQATKSNTLIVIAIIRYSLSVRLFNLFFLHAPISLHSANDMTI